MAEQVYQYDVNTQTLNGRVDTHALRDTIRRSTITVKCLGAEFNKNTGLVSITFAAPLNGLETTELDGIVGAHDGESITSDPDVVTIHGVQTNDDGHLEVAYYKPTDADEPIVSHDWCDPTTWYQKSVRIPEETLVDSGDGLTFNAAHTNIINTYSGLLTGEDFLTDAEGHSYLPVITADGVPVALADVTIDHAAGTVTFDAAPAIPVKMTYHHATTSEWELPTRPDKDIHISAVEVQFSRNINLTTALQFQTTVGGLFDATRPRVYKRMWDYINESTTRYEVPANGDSSNWRNIQSVLDVYRWDYQTYKVIPYDVTLPPEALGLPAEAGDQTIQVFLRMRLDDDIPYGGHDEHIHGKARAVATFHVVYRPRPQG